MKISLAALLIALIGANAFAEPSNEKQPTKMTYDIDAVMAEKKDWELLEWFGSLKIPEAEMLAEEKIARTAWHLDFAARNGFMDMVEGGHEEIIYDGKAAMDKCGAKKVSAALGELITALDGHKFRELRKKTDEPYYDLDQGSRSKLDVTLRALDAKHDVYSAKFSREIIESALKFINENINTYRKRKRG